MREIPLTRGFVAIVDDEDFDWLSQWRWCATQRPGRGYAIRSAQCVVDGRKRGVSILMHRQILDAQPGQLVDHINGDPRDNRRANLRICTANQNSYNRRAYGRWPYKGLNQTASGRWKAEVRAEGRRHHVGTFATAEEAARAYDEAAKRLHGEFARLNFPEAA